MKINCALRSPDWLVAWQASVQVMLPAFDAYAVSTSLLALAQLRYRPPDAWLAELVDEFAAKMPLMDRCVL